MYDREQKTASFLPKHDPLIGPGTYELVRTFDQPKMREESYAPFNSLAPCRPENSTVAEVPGPGQYYAIKPFQHEKGCVSLRNKAKRFISNANINPGPGTYDIEQQISEAPLHNKRSKSTDSKPITYIRQNDPSSIPHPRFAYGFEENDAGQLIAQKGPAQSKPIGPGSYDTTKKITFPGQRYHGIKWEKYAARDTDKKLEKQQELPGPAEYSNPSDFWQKLVLNGQIKNAIQSDRILNIPRFSEANFIRAKKENYPGPGNYELDLKSQAVLPVSEDFPIQKPPFGTQDKYEGRFRFKSEVLPGPGEYNDPRTGIYLKPLAGNMRYRPFNTSSTRFKSRSADDKPAPSSYNVITHDIAYESFKKAAAASFGNPKKAFGSTALRKINEVQKERIKCPAPNAYKISDEITEKTKTKPTQFPLTANFASKSIRLKDPVFNNINVDCMTYNVVESFNSLVKKGPRRYQPLNKEAAKRQGCFLSCSKRNSLQNKGNLENPGPANYLIEKETFDSKKGKFVFKSKRKLDMAQFEQTPGPAHYELAPEVVDSVLKPTFNATLTNPFLILRTQKQNCDLKPIVRIF